MDFSFEDLDKIPDFHKVIEEYKSKKTREKISEVGLALLVVVVLFKIAGKR